MEDNEQQIDLEAFLTFIVAEHLKRQISFNERMYSLLTKIRQSSGIALELSEEYFEVIEDYEKYREETSEDGDITSGD